MKCELVVNTSVYRYAAFAEIAFLERRPELGLVCRMAQDNGAYINIPTVQKALLGVSDTGVSNVIAWCQMLGLCDNTGRLTEAGQSAADNDEVPVPEQGVFELWIAQHALIGRRVLEVKRLTPIIDARYDSVVDVPVEPDYGQVFVSVINTKDRFIVRHPQKKRGPLKGVTRRTKAHCQIRWNLDFRAGQNQWYLQGNLEDGATFQFAGGSVEVNLPSLFADWARVHLADQGRWDPGLKRFLVPFDSLSPAGQDLFKKSFSLPKVRAAGFGEFENVILQDVPIGPASAEDATRWANARLDRRLQESNQPLTYRSRNDLRRLFAELVEGTALEANAPVLPSHKEMIDRFQPTPLVFLSLAAPVDLAPVEPMAEELGSMTTGQELHATVTTANTVHLPYRASCSMSELVEKLMDGAQPRRVLLCDRCIVTQSRMTSLELFLSALRGIHPSAVLDLVTQTEGQDKSVLAAIRNIIGSEGTLRGYHEVFGPIRRNHPHACYLLVAPLGQEHTPFGWQMDNSLLDSSVAEEAPATPKTALRWRDFFAVRLQNDEIPSDLAQWFKGGTL